MAWTCNNCGSQLLGRPRALFVHIFNFLLQSLKLRLIDARYPFDYRPRHPFTQEVLNYFHLSPDAVGKS